MQTDVPIYHSYLLLFLKSLLNQTIQTTSILAELLHGRERCTKL